MMSGRWFRVFLGLVLVLTLASCLLACEEEPADNGRLGVVVTIPPLADFVENVGGDLVDVLTVMVPAGRSPHSYEPLPSQLEQVARADVFVKVGSGVEFELVWMEKMIERNREMLVVDCSTGIARLGNDPHIWNSPANAIRMVENICEGLAEADHPDNRARYEAGRDRYVQELSELDTYIHERLDGFPNRYFMIYHPAFGYFAKEYGLVQLAIEPEGGSITGKVIQGCIDEAEEHELKYVFVAPQFAADNAEVVAEAIGGQIASVDPLGALYIPNMRSVADAIALELE